MLAVVIGAAGAIVILTSGAGQTSPPGWHLSPGTPAARLGGFRLLFLGGIAVGIMDEALDQHLVPYLTAAGFDTRFAALALGSVSLGFVAGQRLGGLAADRWGPSIGAGQWILKRVESRPFENSSADRWNTARSS